MARPATHIDPMSGMFEHLAHRLADIVCDHIDQKLEARPASSTDHITMIEPGKRFFTAKELSERWDLSKQRIYAIPEQDLPAIYVGPNRGKKLYRSLDVYLFEQTITKSEYDHALQTPIEPILENKKAKITRLR